MKTISLFSRSILGKLRVGAIVPIFNKSKKLKVTEKYKVLAKGIKFYKGGEYIHNLFSKKSSSKGYVIAITGPKKQIKNWQNKIDKLEKSYGLQGETRYFKKINKTGRIKAKIYFLKDLKKIGNKDGKLKPLK